jgi:hypothetical protein
MATSKLDVTQGVDFQSELSKMFSSFTDSRRRLLSELMGLSKMKLPAFPNLRTGFDYFGMMGTSHLTLATHGWFISLDFTSTETSFSAAKCFLSGQIEKGSQLMVEHYREVLGEIQKEVETAFPSRRAILRKAFDAHRRKDYELSIPVMLSQADGIGEDIFGKDISPTSQHRKNVEARRKFVEGKFDSATRKILGGYYSLITSLLPINAGKSGRVKFNSPLNRHLILHGIDIGYATEINALKAASWLQYIISFK